MLSTRCKTAVVAESVMKAPKLSVLTLLKLNKYPGPAGETICGDAILMNAIYEYVILINSIIDRICIIFHSYLTLSYIF